MGGQKESFGGNRLQTMKRTEENSCVVLFYSEMSAFILNFFAKITVKFAHFHVFFSISLICVWIQKGLASC